MSDLREGCDGLQADMAGHQSRFSGEVTAESNRALAADAFARIDRERSDAPPPPPLGAIEPSAVAPIETKTERKEVDGKGYLVSTQPDDHPLMRPANDGEMWFLAHAMPRVELLLTKLDTGPMGQPSWNQRLMAVLNLKAQSSDFSVAGFVAEAKDFERRYVHELMVLLEESSASFGDWKKDPERKLYST